MELKFKRLLFSSFVAGLLLTSCASKQDVVYFQDAGNFETIVSDFNFEPKFKIDDELSIVVSTLDKEASIPFNIFQGAQEGEIRPKQVSYLVDKDGEIEFPVIGKVKVVGLTAQELRLLLQDKLSDYLKNPIINIRLKNFTVTILGQVNKPGTYAVEGEKITIMEALGLAGDLNIKGQRQNVLVIREFEGTKLYTRIDLTSKNAFESPVYYLTQNDVVYVEPNQSAVTSSSLDNRASILVSIASLLITSTVLIITRN
ncbi:polysaccharide biosynthesis/export family protein [Flagellimonas sp. DF-77]|uniref:polysaccharide biosynthesis/export family protein n=1 Tax=Flagellimonas algarum TaxID=3230298 RepID=UPI0033931909